MKIVFFLLLIAFVQPFLPNEFEDYPTQISDGFLFKKNMARWLGEEHLSFNKKFKGIQKIKPIIWGYANRIILMLEVGYDEETCITTRNVIFWLNPQAPQTLISPTVKELIVTDCRLYEILTERLAPIPININGREVKANINRGRYQNSNILGMDFITANCVEFKMKINK